jgi:hypothetical protein
MLVNTKFIKIRPFIDSQATVRLGSDGRKRRSSNKEWIQISTTVGRGEAWNGVHPVVGRNERFRTNLSFIKLTPGTNNNGPAACT